LAARGAVPLSGGTYERIRAACCEEHGLGQGITFRNDPRMLDEHAHYIEKLVIGGSEVARENDGEEYRMTVEDVKVTA
jgi:hypothetical protein